MARQRRRRRVVLDVVRHDHRVDGRGQATDAAAGRYATGLTLLSGRVVHQGGRRLLRFQGHVPVVVHLVRAVVRRRARVVRRGLARARVHGLHLLLIVSLIVATAATAAAAGPAEDAGTTGHLLVAARRTADAGDLALLPVVVVAVVRMVLVMVVVVVMRAAEKVRGTHVVLQVPVIVRRRVLGLRHHHLVHLRRLVIRQRVVREKRVHGLCIQLRRHCDRTTVERKAVGTPVEQRAP